VKGTVWACDGGRYLFGEGEISTQWRDRGVGVEEEWDIRRASRREEPEPMERAKAGRGVRSVSRCWIKARERVRHESGWGFGIWVRAGRGRRNSGFL